MSVCVLVQTVMGVHARGCFHCHCAKHDRTRREKVDRAPRRTWEEFKHTAVTAMTEGTYGALGEWKRHLKSGKPKAIMHMTDRHGEPHLEPVNWSRYTHCRLVTGVVPDVNPLWSLRSWNLPQQCRDDELHHMRIGMMPHIIAAAMTKITLVLHPAWARDIRGAWPGVAGMRRVWQRLGGRVSRTGTCTDWVCDAFERGSASREKGDQYKFVLTGHECELLFLMLAQCLPNIVEPELRHLASVTTDVSRRALDPVPSIHEVLARVIGWYMNTKMQVLSDSQIDEQHVEAGCILELLENVFPVRNKRVPDQKAGPAPGERSAKRDRDAEPDPAPAPDQDSDTARDNLGADDSEDDVFRGDDRDRVSALRMAFSKWAFPKGHAMTHIRETLRLYGSLSNVSAESMERLHLKLKKWFLKVEPGPTAQLQVLVRVVREEQAMLRHGALDERGPGCGLARTLFARPPVCASFGDKLHRSGKQYAVWLAILGWRKCQHQLRHRARMVFNSNDAGRASQQYMILGLAELLTPSSYWCEQTPALRHLAHHLAVYIQHEYPALVPAADQGRLTPHEARQLLNAVRPWQLQQRTNQHLDTSAHLSVWHALSITHPDIGDAARPAQVCQLLHCAWHREVGLYVSPRICEVAWHVALALAS